MLPAASVTGLPAKTAQPAPHHSAARTAHTNAPETTRSSGGESAAAHVKLHTAQAMTAPEQTAVAPRLRDQETADRSTRLAQPKDAPTGPPPSFEESPLERQARVAFDPPDLPIAAPQDDAVDSVPPAANPDDPEDVPAVAAEELDPPPTPTQRAEASFTETKTLAHAKEPATVDVSR